MTCNCTECKAARNEPFVSPGFFLGSQWYSYDNGLTWTQYSQHKIGAAAWATVVDIDEKNGCITLKVSTPESLDGQ